MSGLLPRRRRRGVDPVERPAASGGAVPERRAGPPYARSNLLLTNPSCRGV